MKIISVIPARAGSKGVNNKNIRNLFGKPLIIHTIEFAIKNPYISKVIVSTDSDVIKELALKYPVFIVDRPKYLASDDATTDDVVVHALNEYSNFDKSNFDLVLLLQCTSPLRKSEDIKLLSELFQDKKVNTVFSVNKINSHHPARTYTIEKNFLKPNFPHLERKRRQELPCFYIRNGTYYIVRKKQFDEQKKLIIYPAKPFMIDSNLSVDIDSIEDFSRAEFIMRNNNYNKYV